MNIEDAKKELLEELKGKNLKRVLPQVKKMIRINKNRFQAYILMSFLSGFLGIGGFFINFIPVWVKWLALIFFPFIVFSVFADYRSYRHQQWKAKVIEDEINRKL